MRSLHTVGYIPARIGRGRTSRCHRPIRQIRIGGDLSQDHQHPLSQVTDLLRFEKFYFFVPRHSEDMLVLLLEAFRLNFFKLSLKVFT